MTTILLVEDDSVLLETLSYNFERAGFQVATASDGLTGLEMARRTHPDLIILDVMLPGLDGFSVCRAVAKETTVPIVLLTALHDEAHRIAGLELGAIDYVVKPFSMGELLARVRAILRWNERQRQTPSSNVLCVGPVQLDRNSRRAIAVLPTPVGPRNSNVARGRRGLPAENPKRARFSTRMTASMARS